MIGGGAMGCSLLYHLAKLGWGDVVLVEENELTAGSTWHAAGLCTHFAHNLTIMQMRAYSVRLYKFMLAQETGRPVGFHQSGALRVTELAGTYGRIPPGPRSGSLPRISSFTFCLQKELKEVYPLVETANLLGASAVRRLCRSESGDACDGCRGP